LLNLNLNQHVLQVKVRQLKKISKCLSLQSSEFRRNKQWNTW